MGSCPDGLGPDLLYRLPLAPYFDQPYGQDCYFSQLGYNIIGGIIVVLAVVGILVILTSIHGKETRHLKITRFAVVLQNINVIAALITGWLDLINFHYVYLWGVVWFMCSVGLTLNLGKHSIVDIITRVEGRSGVTIAKLIGGTVQATLLTIAMILGVLLAVSGACGASVSMHLRLYDQAALFFRIQASGMMSATAASIIVVVKIVGAFVTIVSKIDGMAQRKDNADIKDVIKRFSLARKSFLVLGVTAVVVFICHASFLPVFWFVIMGHFCMLVGAGYAMWFALTPMSRRRRLLLGSRPSMLRADTTSKPQSKSAGESKTEVIAPNVDSVAAWSGGKD